MKREVIIVGGGVAGIQSALRLADRGIRPTIVDREPDLGGKLRGWHVLFPSFTPASEILTELRRRIREGGDWQDWVPPAVAAYILSQGLYRDPGAILTVSPPSAHR